MIYMWKEERGQPYYRFQTESRKAADKMKRRQNFKLVGWGVNCQVWVFVAKINRGDTAKKVLKTLSGNVVKFDKNEDLFYSPTDLSDAVKEAA
ncbi:MAG: hypothetical protein KGZ85_15615 [Ignavibacterium sp.]|nr:hypothetical protein [Ignavibacterium sp.]